MWNREQVDFVQSQDIPWQVIPVGEFGAKGGGLKRVLSRDPQDGAESSVLQVRDLQVGVLPTDVDIFVVNGEGTLNGRTITTGDYVYIPAGTAITLQPSVVGLTVFYGPWGAPLLDAEAEGSTEGVVIRSIDEEEWIPAGWSGEVKLEPGAMAKPMRQADGVNIYMAAMLPGWKCPLEESHPVYEESFKIYGDVLMGARGVITEGGYFFRRPDVFHGPLYSRSGTLSFIRSDGRTTTTYREPEPGGTWQELSAKAYPVR